MLRNVCELRDHIRIRHLNTERYCKRMRQVYIYNYMTHKKWQEAEYLYFSEMVLPVFEKNYPKENESNKLAPSGTTSHVKRLRYGQSQDCKQLEYTATHQHQPHILFLL